MAGAVLWAVPILALVAVVAGIAAADVSLGGWINPALALEAAIIRASWLGAIFADPLIRAATLAVYTISVSVAVVVLSGALHLRTVSSHPAGMADALAKGLGAHAMTGTVVGTRSLRTINAAKLRLALAHAFHANTPARTHPGARARGTIETGPSILALARSVETDSVVRAVVLAEHQATILATELLEAAARAVVACSAPTADGSCPAGGALKDIARCAFPSMITPAATVGTGAVSGTFVWTESYRTIWTTESVEADTLTADAVSVLASVACLNGAVEPSPARIATAQSRVTIALSLSGTIVRAFAKGAVTARVTGIAAAKSIFADTVVGAGVEAAETIHREGLIAALALEAVATQTRAVHTLAKLALDTHQAIDTVQLRTAIAGPAEVALALADGVVADTVMTTRVGTSELAAVFTVVRVETPALALLARAQAMAVHGAVRQLWRRWGFARSADAISGTHDLLTLVLDEGKLAGGVVVFDSRSVARAAIQASAVCTCQRLANLGLRELVLVPSHPALGLCARWAVLKEWALGAQAAGHIAVVAEGCVAADGRVADGRPAGCFETLEIIRTCWSIEG